jgi:hypothetical protein
MKKTLLAILAGMTLGTGAHAEVGWTYDQCVRAWGQPTSSTISDDSTFGKSYMYDFQHGKDSISVFMNSHRIVTFQTIAQFDF